MPTDRLWGWIVAVGLALIAFGIRFVNLAVPNKLVFDETYYPKDAWSMLRYGYETQWPDGDVVNPKIAAGDVDLYLQAASFAVHPPLGKWLIALGELTFGMNSFGWRFPSLVFGSLMVLVLVRLVRRVSRSTLIGGLAGLLLTLDGLHFVMSRTGLLDIFLAFFLIAAVACLAADRDWFRHRLARHLQVNRLADLGGGFGPLVWFRPWRLAAGVLFGLACGVKWNALYLLAAFALLSLAWDIGARRLAGAGRRSTAGLLLDGVPAFVSLVVVGALTYLATWTGWLATTGGYFRTWHEEHPDAMSVRLLGGPLASLWQLHKEIYGFHSGEFINNAEHPYDAKPLGWLVVARPIGIDAVNDIPPGTQGCPPGGDNCLQVVSGMGTPMLWWAALIAIVFAAFFWIGFRDWRFAIPVVGLLSAWLPWFFVGDRPQFFFYAITIIPFTVMALALCLGKVLGPAVPGERRLIGAVAVGGVVALIGANFAFIYPILTDRVITYQQWLARMWFKSWI
ncbi:dolichyl-phosphate-mannose--protein mannosyltransferase [Propionibacteriaceae bacterium Y2011]|uniref:dolichyl-phosphate-mannose--protein mannosyltransferase n=1 Tax=Microlunatus sp. Y2014 TaxID=3418488 RepID=UPI003B4BE36B